MNITQFIPQDICLKCDGCCRFNYPDTIWAPLGRKTVSYQDYYICEWFTPKTHKCKDYKNRPLDCLFYPFLLPKKNEKIYLAVHLACPYISEKINSLEFNNYAEHLSNFLKSKDGKKLLKENLHICAEYDGDLKLIARLDIEEEPLGKPLEVEDKIIFEKYLSKTRHELSIFSFANILIWQAHFDIRYRIIKDNLCVFFKDRIGCFMCLPPLGKNVGKETLEGCFKIMNSQNEDQRISRIENIEEGQADFYKKLDFKLYPKDKEYIYERKDLVTLAGDKFKSKRANYNYFIKHYDYEFSLLEKAAINDCLKTLENWKKERLSRPNDPPERHLVGRGIQSGAARNKDELYRNILEDNFLAQKEALLNYGHLGLSGRVIRIEGEVKAYTLGFELNKDIFCILAEVCDLKFKGMPQFLFREFCRMLDKYKYINVMDDSGLVNLRTVKLSYHPTKEINSYIAESQ
ncbi:MAG: phosphatidylglycerol lysyltransferase domain-containing protein [Candidatus Omnitrophota bacterium]